MEHCTKKAGDEKEIPLFGRDSVEQAMRQRIRETIEALVKEELDAALGASTSARVGEQRQGYRHGTRERTLTNQPGARDVRDATGADPAGRREAHRMAQRDGASV
jgi:hypothetical protein